MRLDISETAAETLQLQFLEIRGAIGRARVLPETRTEIQILCALTDGQTDVQFTDVYGDIDSQLHAVKVKKKVLRKRQVYLDMIEKQT